MYTVLNYALNDAIKRRHINFNPATAVSLPKKQQAEEKIHYWTAEEIGTFFERAGDHWVTPIVRVALHTGMRRGELLGLRWSDVAEDLGHLTVRRTLTNAGTAVIEGTPKNGRTRTIELDSDVVDVLRSIRLRQREQQIAASVWMGADDLHVFTDEIGRPLVGGRVTNEFKRLVARTGVQPIRFHDLRHTCATLMLSAGVAPLIVSRMLGHATVAFTMDVYGHVMPKDRTSAAETLRKAIRGI